MLIPRNLINERIVQQARARRLGKFKRDERFRERVIRWARFKRNKKKASDSKARKAAYPYRMYSVAAKLKRHGLTVDQYRKMLADQEHRCAICRADNVGDRRRMDEFSWHIDHDHRSGKVRGLLCIRCNIALGLVADDPTVLLAMRAYLQKHEIK